jgi:proteasome assembly chaperone (PAC2) family protein
MSLRWEHEPVLHDPVLVAAFSGWNDAADAASDAVDWLAARYGATEFATIDEQQHVDFQAQRPRVTLADGAIRDVEWPRYSLRAAATPDGEPDLVLVSGPEPNYDWKGFCAAITDAAARVGARTVVTFGGLLADTPHTRHPAITGSTTDAESMGEIGMSRSRYEGPTGIVGIFHDTARRAGYRSASLWVPVPHYVASAPNPPAIVALLEGFGTYVGMDVDVRELEVAASAWRARVDAAVAADDDLRGYVADLELQADDELEDLDDLDDVVPDGEAIAEAFEEYLRDQGT